MDRELEKYLAAAESAEQKANDYHEEILAAHADRDRLAQALWDTWAALGHDTDGDTGPGAFIAGMGYDGFAAMVVKDAATFREESESDYDIDTSELKAEVERYRALHESVRAQANVALVVERVKLNAKLAQVRELVDAEDARVAQINDRLQAEGDISPKTGRPYRVVGILTTRDIRAALDA